MNQVEFLGIAHTFVTVQPSNVQNILHQACSKKYGYSSSDKIFTAVKEVLLNNYRSRNLIGPYRNKLKKFDFIHQTISCQELRVGWA